MRQALHILKKDIRYLQYEIAALITLSGIYAWVESRGFSPEFGSLLMIVAGAVIGLVIHADAIPGDRQFWLTRPYRWKSLLAAKLLFVVLFVNLPVFIARILIVVFSGIPLRPALSGVFWSQLWLLLLLGTPIAIAASLTRGFVPFAFSILASLAILPALMSGGRRFVSGWSPSFAWIRDFTVLAIMLALSAYLFWNQFKRRRTAVSRAVAGGAVVLVVAVYSFLPASFGWAVQSRLSRQRVADSMLQLNVTPVMRVIPLGRIGRAYLVEGRPVFDLHMVVSDLPQGQDVYIDEVAFVFNGRDGRSWRDRRSNLGPLSADGRIAVPVLWIDPAFFDAEHDAQVTFTVSVYFTLFGNPRERTIRLDNTPATVMDDLQCYGNYLAHITCRSVNRLSASLVSLKSGPTSGTLRGWLSYAPVLSRATLNPILEDGSTHVQLNGEVTLAVSEPLAHVRRDFTIANLRIDDYISGRR